MQCRGDTHSIFARNSNIPLLKVQAAIRALRRPCKEALFVSEQRRESDVELSTDLRATHEWVILAPVLALLR